jgi:hypothetical protein
MDVGSPWSVYYLIFVQALVISWGQGYESGRTMTLQATSKD